MTGNNGTHSIRGRLGIGVLALQGDFARHRAVLERLSVAAREVRVPTELEGLEGLVLPGGESTTMLTLMEREKMVPAIRRFHRAGGALFGTCAGLILLARRVMGPAQPSLGLLDVDVERNTYGRQGDSFEADLPWFEDAHPLRGVFIRAPGVVRVGEGVRVLARVRGRPVLVRDDRILAAAFHPELTSDLRLHRYFIHDVASRAPRPVPTSPLEK